MICDFTQCSIRRRAGKGFLEDGDLADFDGRLLFYKYDVAWMYIVADHAVAFDGEREVGVSVLQV